MGINKYNCEGYADMTAYKAMKNIEAERKGLKAYKPMVYISAKRESLRKYCRFAVKMGCIPINPWLIYPQFLDEKSDRDLILRFGDIIMDRCSEVWIFDTNFDKNMKEEIKRADRKEYAIRVFDEWENLLRTERVKDNVGSWHFRQCDF